MSEELEVLGIVTGRLDAEGIPYMVTGSMAVNYYGVPRMTRDIDIVVKISITDLDRLCALFQNDFYLERETIRESIGHRTTFNVIHAALVVKVDFVVRKDTEYRRAEFARKRRVSLAGHPFFTVAPEDLIISRLEWAKDTYSDVQLADVRNLLRSVPEIDRSYVAQWTTRLGLDALPRGVPVRDTAPEMDEKYRAMPMARSGEARLRMGDSMCATARALVVASILERDPSASPAALRQAVFLRFYGHEFDAATRDRILRRLAFPDDGEAQPPRKRVPTGSSRPCPSRSGIDDIRTTSAAAVTVAELIEILRGLSPDLQVGLEGCDCVGDASGVTVRDGQALITRPDGVYSAASTRARQPRR
jgi:hypothetical protein